MREATMRHDTTTPASHAIARITGREPYSLYARMPAVRVHEKAVGHRPQCGYTGQYTRWYPASNGLWALHARAHHVPACVTGRPRPRTLNRSCRHVHFCHPPVSMKVVCDEKMRSPHDLEAARCTSTTTWPVQCSGQGRVANGSPARQWKEGPGRRVTLKVMMRRAWHTAGRGGYIMVNQMAH